MRGEEVILVNFPISHFLKSLGHSALHAASTLTYPWDDDLDVICIGGGVQKL